MRESSCLTNTYRTALFTAVLILLVPTLGAAQVLFDESVSADRPAVSCNITPFSSDGYTALLDHFDGSTIGNVNGSITFGPSVKGIGKALEFSKGAWLEYALYGWYQWNSDYSPDGKSGAIELWIKPARSRKAGDFLTINWFSTTTAPGSGYITHLGLDTEGRLTFGGWSSINNNPYDTPFTPPHWFPFTPPLTIAT